MTLGTMRQWGDAKEERTTRGGGCGTGSGIATGSCGSSIRAVPNGEAAISTSLWLRTGRSVAWGVNCCAIPIRADDDYYATREWYTDHSARELLREGRHMWPLAPLGHAMAHLAKALVVKAGWLDGRAGLVLAWRIAGSSWRKYAKLRALASGRTKTVGDTRRGGVR